MRKRSRQLQPHPPLRSASAAGTTGTTSATTRPVPSCAAAARTTPISAAAKPAGCLSVAARRAGSLLPWLGIALIVILLDPFSKTLIIGMFRLHDSHTVTSFFNLVRVHNTGAAFSFLSG